METTNIALRIWKIHLDQSEPTYHHLCAEYPGAGLHSLQAQRHLCWLQAEPAWTQYPNNQVYMASAQLAQVSIAHRLLIAITLLLCIFITLFTYVLYYLHLLFSATHCPFLLCLLPPQITKSPLYKPSAICKPLAVRLKKAL